LGAIALTLLVLVFLVEVATLLAGCDRNQTGCSGCAGLIAKVALVTKS